MNLSLLTLLVPAIATITNRVALRIKSEDGSILGYLEPIDHRAGESIFYISSGAELFTLDGNIMYEILPIWNMYVGIIKRSFGNYLGFGSDLTPLQFEFSGDKVINDFHLWSCGNFSDEYDPSVKYDVIRVTEEDKAPSQLCKKVNLYKQ